MTFGQRLKKYRKLKNLTQTELAEAIGVSTQAISKWETDTGMPDISQIVPLSRELSISSDILLGIVNDETDSEFENLYKECMEAENVASYSWPPDVKMIVPFFQKMYCYFSAHPNHRAQQNTFLIKLKLIGETICFLKTKALPLKNANALRIAFSATATMPICKQKLGF